MFLIFHKYKLNVELVGLVLIFFWKLILDLEEELKKKKKKS